MTVSWSEIARQYLAVGLCVLPARRDQKRPTVPWKQFQKRLPTEAELEAWFASGQTALCILTGAISGNHELIDFDQRGALFDAWRAKVREAMPGLVERLVVSKTQNDGRHAKYRFAGKVCGNMKLAQRRGEDGKVVTLIETRGEGGLYLCAPTPGYAVIQGDLCDLPVLSEEERGILLQCAWELNEHLPPVVDGPKTAAGPSHMGRLSADHGAAPANRSNNVPTPADSAQRGPTSAETGPTGANNAAVSADSAAGPAENSHPGGSPANRAERPGDDFNNRGDVRAVLTKSGWRCTKGGENEHWRRPGKAAGNSATLKGRVFYVFSSNADPFEPNQGYSPFAVYTLLEHGGNYEQAARSLRLSGYGSDCAADSAAGVDISAIVGLVGTVSANNTDSPPENPGPPDPGPLPDELLRVPGFISEVMAHTEEKTRMSPRTWG